MENAVEKIELGFWGLHNEIDHIVAEYRTKVCLKPNSCCQSPSLIYKA